MRAAFFYTNGRGRGYSLYILAPGELHLGRAGETHFQVAGKREARAICKAHGAKPWNF